jgi:hypothetical protein
MDKLMKAKQVQIRLYFWMVCVIMRPITQRGVKHYNTLKEGTG